MRNPYREPASRAIATSSRIPGRVLVGVCTAACALVSAALILGTRRTQSVSVALPPTPVITNLPDTPEVLYEGTWPELDVRLIGIDARKGEAAIELVRTGAERRRVFDTIDYQHHALVEQWEIPNGKDNYPPAWDGELDLVHMARYVRLRRDAMFPFGLDPMMAVDPSSGAIVYDQIPKDGHDGDNLFMVGADGKNPRRIDDGLTASYDPTFSPDGERIAIRACGRPCKYFLHLVDPKTRVPIRVADVPEPRTYAWSLDSTALWVLSRPDEHAATLFRVDRKGNATKLFQGAIEGAELEVSPDRTVAVVAGRGRFVFVDLVKNEVMRDRPLDAGSLMSVGAGGVLLSTDRAGIVAYDPRTEKRASWPFEGWYVQPWYGAWEKPGVAILVRTKAPTMQLVRLRVEGRLR